MTNLQIAVAGTRNGDPENFTLGASEVNSCMVWVIDKTGSKLEAEGSDFFEAFVALRLQLERRGIYLRCNGSRVDVYPSAAQRQLTKGRKAYVLAHPRSSRGAQTVDIFAEAPTDTEPGTVEQQRRWFDEWRHTPFAD